MSEEGEAKECLRAWAVCAQRWCSGLRTKTGGLLPHSFRRPTYNLSVHEPVAGNYFPVNTQVSSRQDTVACQCE
jgi:hypothetical protein